jgi:spore maturation protein CgeB
MKYRFLKLTSAYPEFLNDFVKKNPEFGKLSYDEMYKTFLDERFWMPHAEYIEKFGNVSATYISSFEILQKQWARENNIKFNKNSWLREITIAQIKAFNPDVIFLADLYLFNKKFRKIIRDVCSNDILLIGYRSAPTDNYADFLDLNFVFSSNKSIVHNFIKNKVNAVLIPLAFESTYLNGLNTSQYRDLPFTFVGSISGPDSYFSQRYTMIKQLLQRTPIQIWTKSSKNFFFDRSYRFLKIFKTVPIPERVIDKLRVMKKINSIISNNTSFIRELREQYPSRFHSAVYGKEYYEILARSEIAFNVHIDVAENYVGNLRLFEATALGSCLLTDWKEDLPEYFIPDKEVIAYIDVDDCVQKVTYLLDNEMECRKIAQAGQKRTLHDHNFEKRMSELNTYIQKVLMN